MKLEKKKNISRVSSVLSTKSKQRLARHTLWKKKDEDPSLRIKK